MKVSISDKEQSRIKEASTYYESQGLEVEVCNLEIGDYIFTDGNDEVVFEFKTIADFVASIQDNRVFNEAINQAENFDWHYVVIHGNEADRTKCLAMTKHYQPVTIFQFHGSIASINRYSTVIECYTPWINEAFYKMYIQAKKCLQNKPIVKKFPKKHKNPAMNYLTYCVYGLNHKRANDIVTELKLNTLESLLTLNHEKLTHVNGIGPKLADRILHTINEENL